MTCCRSSLYNNKYTLQHNCKCKSSFGWLGFNSLTRERVSPYSNEFSICRQLGSNAIILSPSFSRCMLLWNICAPFVSRANLELLFVYAKFLFQHLSTEILTLCCFGVHRRVHGPQNRMKIEVSQQLNFRSENAPGTWGGTWNTDLCRFLTKSKSIYKNTSRTPYKPPVEIMKIKWNKKIWCSRGVHGQEKSTHESFVSAWFSSSGTQDWTADLMIMNHAL